MKSVPAVVLLVLAVVAIGAARVETITDEGTTWTASTWGYSSPKLLYDGQRLYAVALIGTGPRQDVAKLFWRDAKGWHPGAQITPVYQPTTILLDAENHINLFCTESGTRGFHWRSTRASDVSEFAQAPLPEPEKFAFGYLGAGRSGQELALCGLDTNYGMWITTRAGNSDWRKPVLLAIGQKEQEPWTSPVYPIVIPDGRRVHIIYSNCPDGSVHNTYNQVEYVEFDPGKSLAKAPEMIAQGPVGEITYGLDAARASDGTMYCIYFARLRAGDDTTAISQRHGLYCSVRAPDGTWRNSKITSSIGTAQLHLDGPAAISVFESTSTGAVRHRSLDGGRTWKSDPTAAWGEGSFLYLLKPSSGSVIDGRIRRAQSRKIAGPGPLGNHYMLQYIELDE